MSRAMEIRIRGRVQGVGFRPTVWRFARELRLNGEVRQKSSTSELIYGVKRLIEFASSFYTLYPGDLIYTGTPDGVGPVKAGDMILVTSGAPLGTLEVAVRARTAAT